MKMMPTHNFETLFNKLNLEDYLFAVGVSEFTLANLLLYRQTEKYAMALLTFFMGAAVMTHILSLGASSSLFPILFTLVLWSGYCLRRYF
jgi:hypothetical protein